jgi:hypothetical protein
MRFFFFGSISVDQDGIKFKPLFLRSLIQWPAIEQWEILTIEEIRMARMRVKGASYTQTLTISTDWLSNTDLKDLERQLRRHAGAAERRV